MTLTEIACGLGKTLRQVHNPCGVNWGEPRAMTPNNRWRAVMRLRLGTSGANTLNRAISHPWVFSSSQLASA
jgi:hypothetical protein